MQIGERLPSEAQLSEQFDVSRTAVREAIKILSAKGLVKVRQGSGAVVSGNLNEAVTESLKFVMYQMKTTISELMEARRTLEVEIAGIAAKRATEEDLMKLRQTLNIGKQKVEDLESYVELDVQFHLELARATHNSVFLIMIHPILNLMRAGMLVSYLGYIDRELKPVIYHEQIFKAVQAGDVEAARSAMHQHFLSAERGVQEAIRKQKLPQELWKQNSQL